MACPSKKPTIIIFVEGLNRKAFKEAGRWNTDRNHSWLWCGWGFRLLKPAVLTAFILLCWSNKQNKVPGHLMPQMSLYAQRIKPAPAAVNKNSAGCFCLLNFLTLFGPACKLRSLVQVPLWRFDYSVVRKNDLTQAFSELCGRSAPAALALGSWMWSVLKKCWHWIANSLFWRTKMYKIWKKKVASVHTGDQI
jgi:hypothetical protein